MSFLDDKKLMVQVSAGDQRAFAQLVAKHSGALLHFCYATVNNEEMAKDVLQQVLIVWWQKAANWDKNRGALSTWLHRIAYNKCVDAMRSTGKMTIVELDADQHKVDAIADKNVENAEIRLKVGKEVLELPEKQRRAMFLTYYEDKTNAEVAKDMDLSVKAVESLLVRARKKLKPKLGGLEI